MGRSTSRKPTIKERKGGVLGGKMVKAKKTCPRICDELPAVESRNVVSRFIGRSRG